MDSRQYIIDAMANKNNAIIVNDMNNIINKNIEETFKNMMIEDLIKHINSKAETVMLIVENLSVLETKEFKTRLYDKGIWHRWQQLLIDVDKEINDIKEK